jgi:hypothetical protein
MAMLFETQDARARFFRNAETPGANLPFGSWIDHARSTNLGVWGRIEELEADCARIAAAEIWHLDENGTVPSAEDVASTDAFRRAFNAARTEPEHRLTTVLQGLLPKDHQILEERQSENDIPGFRRFGETLSSGESVAHAIARELRACPREHTAQGYRF